MPTRGNGIYSKLVHDKDDTIGLVAYSLYKRKKINHLILHKAKSNILQFTKENSTQEQLDEFRTKATTILQEFVDTFYDEVADKIEEGIRNEQIRTVKKIVDESLEKYEDRQRKVIKELKRPLWIEICVGVAISAISIIVFALLAFAFNNEGKIHISVEPDTHIQSTSRP